MERRSCYCPNVSYFRASSPVMAALFALILGLFATGPMVDALTCGPESTHSCEAGLTAGDHSEDDSVHDKDILHSCSHGHCHSASDVPPRLHSVALYRSAQTGMTLPSDPRLVSATSDGLIRPPRA